MRAIECESPQASYTTKWFYKLSIFLGTGINGHESTSSGIAEIFPNPSYPQDPPWSDNTIVWTSPQDALINFKWLRAFTSLGIG